MQLNAPKLKQILHFNIKIETVTGLLISTGRTLGRIGGIDAEPMSVKKEYICGNNKILVKVPYIPGSSLKGRMRSLLELYLGLPLYSTDQKIWAHTPSKDAHKTLGEDKLGIEEFLKDIGEHKLDRLFGYSSFSIKELEDIINAQQQKTNQPSQSQPTPNQPNPPSTGQGNPSQQGGGPNQPSIDVDKILKRLTPTLLLVDDFFVETNQVCDIHRRKGTVSFEDFVEEKNENRIDRITSMADPRTILRVKPGVRFEGKISLLIFENMFEQGTMKEELREYLELLLNGLSLVETTYLGASGSRGYGRVKFVDILLSATKVEGGLIEEEKVEGGEFKDLKELKDNLDKIIEKISKDLNVQKKNTGT